MGRPIDYLTVKGKSRAIQVFEALAPRESATERDGYLCSTYQAAFEAYRDRAWDSAQSLLEEILGRYPDRPSEVLLQRVRTFIAHPPAGEWDGAFSHTAK